MRSDKTWDVFSDRFRRQIPPYLILIVRIDVCLSWSFYRVWRTRFGNILRDSLHERLAIISPIGSVNESATHASITWGQHSPRAWQVLIDEDRGVRYITKWRSCFISRRAMDDRPATRDWARAIIDGCRLIRLIELIWGGGGGDRDGGSCCDGISLISPRTRHGFRLEFSLLRKAMEFGGIIYGYCSLFLLENAEYKILIQYLKKIKIKIVILGVWFS